VTWVVKELCGPGKPFSGIIVLFDEFSTYIQRYAQRNAAGELQDLLNGVENNKGKAVFLAFAQLDPIVLAKNSLQNNENTKSLIHELTRLPKKFTLYSLLESVIDAYVNQNPEFWKEIEDNPKARGSLVQASVLAMEVFSQRYENVLNWTPEQFDQTVTRGCFPLHPLTTALLCNLKLRGDMMDNPRTILGFVFDEISRHTNDNIVNGDQITWVLPIAIIDYFYQYLPKDKYQEYEKAVERLGSDAPAEQIALLKALMLQYISEVNLREDTQKEFLAQAAGLPYDSIHKHLNALKAARVIQMTPSRMYVFVPVGLTEDIDDIINKHLPKSSEIVDLLDDFNKGGFIVVKDGARISVAVAWGHSGDWQAIEHIMIKESFTAEKLRQLIPPYQKNNHGVQEGPRGCVIWLLALSEDDKMWLRQNAQKILDEAFPGDNPPPVVIIMPQNPLPNLILGLQKRKALQNFTSEERESVGATAINNERYEIERLIRSEYDQLRGDPQMYTDKDRSAVTWTVPAAYRAALQGHGHLSLIKILSISYSLAYRFSPPAFFDQYKVNQTKLSGAVKIIASTLLKNTLGIDANGDLLESSAKDLRNKFLLQKWGLVSVDYKIQVPLDAHVKTVWEVLETKFEPGKKDIKVADILIPLFNVPYGYDYNTATLLFCAWIGYHLKDIELSMGGKAIRIEDLAKALRDSKSLKDFISYICLQNPLSISRRDPSQRIREVEEIIDRVKRGKEFSEDEATKAIAKLSVFCVEETSNDNLCLDAAQTKERLTNAMQKAQTYNTQAQDIQSGIGKHHSITELLPLHNQIANLPAVELVTCVPISREELEADWERRIKEMVEKACQEAEKLRDLQQAALQKKTLTDLKNQLKKANLSSLTERVEKALNNLEHRVSKLEAEQKEAPVLVEIQSINKAATLTQLNAHRQKLNSITGYSEAVISKRDLKLAEIESEIDQLETLARGLIESLASITSSSDLESWKRQLHRSQYRFSDSLYEPMLDEADRNADSLARVIRTLEEIRSMAPSSARDAFNLLNQIRELRNGSGLQLSDNQIALFDQAENYVESYTQQRISETSQYLLDIQRKLDQGVVDESHLQDRNFGFIAPQDRPVLEKLRKKARAKYETDVVAKIESEFLTIADKKTRRECLERLQKLLDE